MKAVAHTFLLIALLSFFGNSIQKHSELTISEFNHPEKEKRLPVIPILIVQSTEMVNNFPRVTLSSNTLGPIQAADVSMSLLLIGTEMVSLSAIGLFKSYIESMPIYGVTAGDNVTISGWAGQESAELRLNVSNLPSPFQVLEDDYSISIPIDFFRVFSTAIPVAAIDIPLMGEVGLIMEINTHPQLVLHCSIGGSIERNHLNFPESGSSDATTLWVAADVQKGDTITLTGDWRLAVSVTLEIKAGDNTLLELATITAGLLDLNSQVSIGVEVGKERPVYTNNSPSTNRADPQLLGLMLLVLGMLAFRKKNRLISKETLM